ncbi:MAG: protein kinase [Myxococcales bacterium]|nr:protein kinase [Myxococcales bacterium]
MSQHFLAKAAAADGGQRPAIPSLPAGCLGELTLLRLVEGEADAAERAEVDAHVDACPQCRSVVAELLRSHSRGRTTARSDVDTSLTAEAPPLAPGSRVDFFVIVSEIGRGGMGTVYLARDTRLERLVALKFLAVTDHDAVARLVREAQLTARFNHPHIVTIHYVGTHQGWPYLALEHLRGPTLRDRLRHGALPLPEALDLALALADALRTAHAAGVLHRDLKPENVVLDEGGRVVVLDFGLSQAAGEGDAQTHGGTPAYMAPEQWAREACTPATDLWAFGVVLHEVVTGTRPGRGVDAAVVVSPAVPPDLRGLIERCLGPAASRPSSAAVLAELSEVRGGVGGLAAPPSFGRSVLAWGVLILALVILSIGEILGAGMIAGLAGRTPSAVLVGVAIFIAVTPLVAGVGAVLLARRLRSFGRSLSRIGVAFGVVNTILVLAFVGHILHADHVTSGLARGLSSLLGLIPLGLGVWLFELGRRGSTEPG